MEIVFEPDLFDGEEAAAVIKELILVLQVWIMSIKYRERERDKESMVGRMGRLAGMRVCLHAIVTFDGGP